MHIQDEYKVEGIWNLPKKWGSVKEYLTYANNNRDKGYLYVNFLSGTEWVFPYFVASGQSSHETAAPLLLAGMQNSEEWSEFPRVLGSTAYEGTNNLTINYLRNHPEIKHAGIIMCDFPGPDLINTIIGLNEFVK